MRHWHMGRTLRHLAQWRRLYGTQHQPHLVRDQWEPVIGLEIHAQISSASKLFSRVSTKYGAPPNTQVGVFESAHPGTLPVLNKRCVEAGVKTALAFGATINKVSRFDRKHYFYPDLPAGYQITQSEYPLASNGKLDFIVLESPVTRETYSCTVDLVQLQLEEDSGKSLHCPADNRVLVDLNRAGHPLMELVFAPGLHSGEEAAAMVKEVILILTRIATCNCRMHEGSLRVDANVSVHRPGEPLGTRTEVKNLNSLRSLVKAINFEVVRQIDLLEAGGTVVNETRSFDVECKETISMRDKEVTQDYRFMPEPNLLPLRLHDSSESSCRHDGSLDIRQLRESMPELPDTTRQRLMNTYNITLKQAYILVSKDELLRFFLAVMSCGRCHSQLVFSLLTNNLLGTLNGISTSIEHSPLSPSALAEVINLQQQGTISNNISQMVIDAICVNEDQRTPTQIVQDNNWAQNCEQMSDEGFLAQAIDKVLHDHPDMVKNYKAKSEKKKKKIINGLMGIIKDVTDNKVNMKMSQEILLQKLNA